MSSCLPRATSPACQVAVGAAVAGRQAVAGFCLPPEGVAGGMNTSCICPTATSSPHHQTPRHLAGIWRLVLDEQLKVKDIWFLRQLTREEKKHRVGRWWVGAGPDGGCGASGCVLVWSWWVEQNTSWSPAMRPASGSSCPALCSASAQPPSHAAHPPTHPPARPPARPPAAQAPPEPAVLRLSRQGGQRWYWYWYCLVSGGHESEC